MSAPFLSLPFNKKILMNLDSLGFKKMTPIQEMALPWILQGHDIIAQAKTGSGKTVAFGLGILAKLDVSKLTVQALVLSPTRELAEQVGAEIRRLARFTGNIKVLTLCGGASIYHQKKSLDHGVHIVIGTPGRVQSLLKQNVLNCQGIATLVLDEADRMLDMGFFEEINQIAAFIPLARQTLLFSATYPDDIKRLSKGLQRNPQFVEIDTKHQEDVIQQHFFEVGNHKEKHAALLALLVHYQPKSAIIFCKTKQICKAVEQALQKNRILALAIHGDLEQVDRTMVLTKFANQSCGILVATDVAARGLDIKDLQFVINYDLPFDPEMYTHRIGRTGRAGKTGRALNLYTANEHAILTDIEKYLGIENQKIELGSLKTDKVFDYRPPMSTLFIGAGRKEKIRPGDILGALTGDAGLLGSDVGSIAVLQVYSYVAICSAKADMAVAWLQSGKIKGRCFRVKKV